MLEKIDWGEKMKVYTEQTQINKMAVLGPVHYDPMAGVASQ